MFRGKTLFQALGLSVLGLFLIAACTGPEGAQGPQGAAGPQGVAGADGADGSDGARGPTGAPGAPGAPGATGPAGADGADGRDGAQGAAGKDAAASEAAATIASADVFVPGSETVTIWLSGFLRRDNVTATITEAFGPGNNYVMGSGVVNPSGALVLTVGSAERPAVPVELAPGIWTVKVTGERVPGDRSGPAVASAALWVRTANEVPGVPGK